MESQRRPIYVGVFTCPKDEGEPGATCLPDGFFHSHNSIFSEINGQAVSVALRYDLIRSPEVLRETLDSLDGVFIGGGMLSIRYAAKMPAVT